MCVHHRGKIKYSERITTKFLMVVLIVIEHSGKAENFHFLLLHAFII